LENLQVAFNCNLFLLLIAAFLPAVVKADAEMLPTPDVSVTEVDGEIQIKFTGAVQADGDFFTASQAKAEGTFDVGYGGGERRLVTDGNRKLQLEILQQVTPGDLQGFTYNAVAKITKRPSGDEFTVNFNVRRTDDAVASIPGQLRTIADAFGFQTDEFMSSGKVADGPGRTLEVTSAELYTESVSPSEFVYFEFKIKVRTILKVADGKDTLTGKIVRKGDAIGDLHYAKSCACFSSNVK
jgi:hypothetical protein